MKLIYEGMQGILKNIVFFMVDQLSAKWLEAATENDVCPLPNFKKLMQGGVTFSNAISSNPICCPARATVATGLTARSHGVLHNGYILDPKLPTFMKMVQQKGYRTGGFGKFHFIPQSETAYPDYSVFGFDEVHTTEDVKVGEWLDWVKENHPEHYDNVLATLWSPHIPDLECYGKEKEDLQSRLTEILDNFTWETEEFPLNYRNAYALPFPKEVSQTEWITNHALDFINSIDNQTPFLANISYVQPHRPYSVPGEYLKLVDEDKLPKAVKAEWVNDPSAPEYFKGKAPHLNDKNAYDRKCYFADLCHLDEQLHKVVECLKTNGKLEDTYIIFVSDHGELLGDHGFYAKNEKHYDACIRVPLIISGPGLQKGIVYNGMVQHEDICPTILSMAETKMSAVPTTKDFNMSSKEKADETYGKSLLDICIGNHDKEREAVYIESYDNVTLENWTRSVRTKEYRYTYFVSDRGEQLFDIKNDPDEQNNLAGNSDYDTIKAKLKDTLLYLTIMQDYPRTRRDLKALGAH